MTKIILAYELLEQQIPKTHIAEHPGVSRRTVIRWAQEIRRYGSLDNYLEYYRQAKKGPRKKRVMDEILKRRIWEIRKKHHQYCGQKIQYFLEKDYGIHVSVTTIYKVLRGKYQLRSKWQKNQKRGPVPSAKAPREVDPAADIISGTAAVGEEIQVNVWDCDVKEYMITDPGGDWSVDFSGSCDIELGFQGSVRDVDDDGDASNIIWHLWS